MVSPMDATTDFATRWAEMDAAEIRGHAPNPPDITPNFEVDFIHNGKVKTFRRQAEHAGAAISSAQHGFQWTYGFWPGPAIDCRSI